MDCSPPGSSVHGILQARIPGSKPGLLHCRQILYNLSHQGSPWPPPNVTLRNHVMSLSTISWWGGRGRIYLPSPSSNWLKICPRGDWLCAFLGCVWNHLGTKLGPQEWWRWEGQGSGREYGLASCVCFRSLSPGRVRIKDKQGQRGLNGSPLQPLRSALAILPFPERGGLSPTGESLQDDTASPSSAPIPSSFTLAKAAAGLVISWWGHPDLHPKGVWTFDCLALRGLWMPQLQLTVISKCGDTKRHPRRFWTNPLPHLVHAVLTPHPVPPCVASLISLWPHGL